MIIINLVYSVLLLILYCIFYLAVPAVVLYPKIKDQETEFRFLFYQVAALAYVSFVSFALCFLKIYSGVTCWISFAVIPILLRVYLSRKSIVERIKKITDNHEERIRLQEGGRMRFRRITRAVRGMLSRVFFKGIIPNFLYLLALLLVVYLTSTNLGYFHLHYYTYACSDEPTHIYWVSCMLQGNAFPVGLYPHGMHFVVGQFCAMFGLNVARAWMSFGIVSVTIIMISAYFVVCKVFPSRIAGLVGIAMYLISNIFQVGIAFGRLLMVIPMEFAMFAFFAMVYGLIAWIKDQKTSSLVMIGLGILGTTLIHFFVTIFAFFIVVAFFLVYHGVMAKKKCIHKLMICGCLSIALAVVPYVTGILLGYQLEQSFSWGMSNVNVGTIDNLNAAESSSNLSGTSEAEEIGNYVIADASANSLKDMIIEADSIEDIATIVGGVMSMYLTKEPLGGFILIGCSSFLIIYGVIQMIRRKDDEENDALAYIFMAVAWILVLLLLYVGYVFQVFSLMVPSRSSEFIAMLSILIMGAPVQIIYDIIERLHWNAKRADSVLTFIAIVAIAVLNYSGVGISYKSFVYSFTMQDTDIKAEVYLSDKKEDDTWTFISTTNARLGIANHGYHYEISDLLNNANKEKEFYIPTKDIYVTVEKIVPWIGSKAVDKSDFWDKSVTVSADLAKIPLSDVLIVENGVINSNIYLLNHNRQVIMSHLYYWMEKMMQVYPNEVSVFMEDENCTVYHIRQDEYFLLNLAVDYSDVIEKALKMGDVV